jgi:SCP-2 sterol transfer family
VTRAYVPGAPPTGRDRAAAARRALARRQRAAIVAVARFVARQPDRHIERLLGLVTVLGLPLVLRLRFRPGYAVDFDGEEIKAMIVVKLLRRDGRQADEFEVMIDRRRCRARRRRGAESRPDAALTMYLADMHRMLVAATDPLMLARDKRLVMEGDTFLLVRFPAMFGQPTRAVV